MKVLKRYKFCNDSLLIKIPSDYLKREVNTGYSGFFMTSDESSYIFIKDDIDIKDDFDETTKKYISNLKNYITKIKEDIVNINGHKAYITQIQITNKEGIFEYKIVMIDMYDYSVCIILGSRQKNNLLWNKEMDYLIKTIRIVENE